MIAKGMTMLSAWFLFVMTCVSITSRDIATSLFTLSGWILWGYLLTQGENRCIIDPKRPDSGDFDAAFGPGSAKKEGGNTNGHTNGNTNLEKLLHLLIAEQYTVCSYSNKHLEKYPDEFYRAVERRNELFTAILDLALPPLYAPNEGEQIACRTYDMRDSQFFHYADLLPAIDHRCYEQLQVVGPRFSVIVNVNDVAMAVYVKQDGEEVGSMGRRF